MTTVFVNFQAPRGLYRHYFESRDIKFVNQITISTRACAHTATSGCPATPEVVSRFQKYVLQRLSKDGFEETLRCFGICYRGGSCGHVAPTGSQWREAKGWRRKNISSPQNVSQISFWHFFFFFFRISLRQRLVSAFP